ncbi:M4 family metallopeptidase [Fibrobacter sp. UWB12]|uniref:M4 family metallopeptidase n=1 Tax=Fibrobacter sp. UWB12 TaxID=1896203 RepID=UPI00091E6325|nr:M4 family metallopeptidase [Fibrobacter sp. UWB12]SHK61069.1 Zn-dependent metalloprotease [Fibrobacter sp. UWB12]
MSSIKMNSSKTYSFVWMGGNNKVIASSANYISEQECLNAIESLKNDCVGAAVEMNTATAGVVKRAFPKFVIAGATRSYYFTFALSSTKILLTSVKFGSIALCLSAIEDVKKNVKTAYDQFMIERRASVFLKGVKEAGRGGNSKLNIRKIGLRKKPEFTFKSPTPLFATKAIEKDNLNKINNARLNILQIGRGKKPTFVDGKFTTEKVTSFKKAISALNSLHHTMGFKNVDQEYKEDSFNSYLKKNFYRLQQYHQGIPVYGRQLVVSTDENGNVESLSGRYTDVSVTSNVVVNEDKAIDLVKKDVPNVMNITSEGLYYYVDKADKSTLCWKIATDFSVYFVDAAKGSFVEILTTRYDFGPATDSGKNMSDQTVNFPVTVDENGTRYLYDSDRNIEVLRCQKANSCDGAKISRKTTPWTTEKDAISAYTNMIKAYDFYKYELGHKGADANGLPIKVIVGFYEKEGEPYPGGACHWYCNGNTNICVGEADEYAKCLDVMGHEYTHGVEHFIWKPIYNDESGALNEAFADIMGEFIQDGVLDEHAEDLKGGPNRYFNDPTKTSYYDSRIKKWVKCPKHYKDKFDGSYDHYGVHINCGIVCYAAYLMQKRWPTNTFSIEMPTAFYLSMHYLDADSNFLNFRSALLAAARVLRLGSEKEKVIAEAFDEVGITYKKDEVSKKTVLTGKVVNQSGNSIVDAMVSLKKNSSLMGKTVTNASGTFELAFETAGKYTLNVESAAYNSLSTDINLPALGANKKYNIGNVELTLKEEKFALVQGTIKNYETNSIESNIEVRIYEGSVDIAKSLNMAAKVVVRTDRNGYYSTNALINKCTYTIVAYKNVTASQYFVAAATVFASGKATCNLTVRRTYRYFVGCLRITSCTSKDWARSHIESPFRLIDKDLNKGAKGDFIYLGYTLTDSGCPVTNLIIYNTKQKQTWNTKTITIDGKTAEYSRIDIDLNKGAKGSFVYLCVTRDSKFAPLTGLDVAFSGDSVDTRYWKYASGTGDYNNGDVNYKTKGKPIYIIFRRD